MKFLTRSLLALSFASMLPISAIAGTTIGVSMAHFDDNFLTTVRDAMAAEDSLIKYARDESSGGTLQYVNE